MLSGKVGLIMGLANDKSISWGIAKVCNNHGAKFAISYQNEILAKRVKPLAEELKSDLLIECDISDEKSIDKAFELIKKQYGQIDFFVHAIACFLFEFVLRRILSTKDFHVDGFGSSSRQVEIASLKSK